MLLWIFKLACSCFPVFITQIVLMLRSAKIEVSVAAFDWPCFSVSCCYAILYVCVSLCVYIFTISIYSYIGKNRNYILLNCVLKIICLFLNSTVTLHSFQGKQRSPSFHIEPYHIVVFHFSRLILHSLIFWIVQNKFQCWMFTRMSWYYCLFLFKGSIRFAFTWNPVDSTITHRAQETTDDFNNGYPGCSNPHLHFLLIVPCSHQLPGEGAGVLQRDLKLSCYISFWVSELVCFQTQHGSQQHQFLKKTCSALLSHAWPPWSFRKKQLLISEPELCAHNLLVL